MILPGGLLLTVPSLRILALVQHRTGSNHAPHSADTPENADHAAA